MTDNNDGTAPLAPVLGDASAPSSQLALQAVYLKDCSYEAPNGPRVDGQWNPQINLDLHTGVSLLTPELREIVLTVTVSAKQGEATMFLVEVKQAGAFLMRNLSDDDARRASSSERLRIRNAPACLTSTRNMVDSLCLAETVTVNTISRSSGVRMLTPVC